eukprot:COSAG01_NODE_2793_length_7060_cov_5.562563_8_plen_129_part_00
MVAAGGVGLVAYLSLALASPASAAAALLCMLGNLSHALPDVMIDASVAVRCKSVSRARSTDKRGRCPSHVGDPCDRSVSTAPATNLCVSDMAIAANSTPCWRQICSPCAGAHAVAAVGGTSLTTTDQL